MANTSTGIQPFADLVLQTDLPLLLKDGYEEPKREPAVEFKDIEEYIAYFEPLILTELRADLANAVEKFAREGGERSAFRPNKHGEDPTDKNRPSKRKDDGGSALRVTLLWSKEEKNGIILELQPSYNPRKVNLHEGDAVALWSFDPIAARQGGRHSIPASTIVGIVEKINTVGHAIVRVTSRKTRLQEGKEVVVLKLGGFVTYQRERDGLHRLRGSALLPDLLHPQKQSSTATINRKSGSAQIVQTIVEKNHLNPSQADALISSLTNPKSFSIVQGPPGTGKTKTLLALLNLIHMQEYHVYYESFLRSIQVEVAPTEPRTRGDLEASEVLQGEDRKGRGELQSMLASLNRTLSNVPRARYKRPRLLVCAPSNAAVDEALTRLTKEGFVDGNGHGYSPELARIGAKDVISEGARFVSAEGQAEAFLERAIGPYSGKGPYIGDIAFKHQWLMAWKTRGTALFLELRQTKKSPETAPKLVEIHEQLERLERDMRRFVVASSHVLSKEDKVRRIEKTYVEDAQLVFSTLSSVATILSSLGGGDVTFETIVIDEAAQATEPSCVIPFMYGVKRCILVGDPQQLPATVFSSGSTKAAYGQSLLERLVRGGVPVLLLDTQYRMHPAISQFPAKHFYHSKLKDGAVVTGTGRKRSYHDDEHKPSLGPYIFFDVLSGSEERGSGQRSVHNRLEAEIAAALVALLQEKYAADLGIQAGLAVAGNGGGIGVVTPYRSQLATLRRAFQKSNIKHPGIEIDTVDAFQGREKDVVVFSCVRTAVNRGIGFVRDVRRMNVGITRARCSMIVLGNAKALSAGSKDWLALVQDAEERGLMYRVGTFARPISSVSDANLKWLQSLVETGGNLASPSDREILSDSIGSGSESGLLRDPRKRREEERQGLAAITGAKEESSSMPIDPRNRSRRLTRKTLGQDCDFSSDTAQLRSIFLVCTVILTKPPIDAKATDDSASDGEVKEKNDAGLSIDARGGLVTSGETIGSNHLQQAHMLGSMLTKYLETQKMKRSQRHQKVSSRPKVDPRKDPPVSEIIPRSNAVRGTPQLPPQASSEAAGAVPPSTGYSSNAVNGRHDHKTFLPPVMPGGQMTPRDQGSMLASTIQGQRTGPAQQQQYQQLQLQQQVNSVALQQEYGNPVPVFHKGGAPPQNAQQQLAQATSFISADVNRPAAVPGKGQSTDGRAGPDGGGSGLHLAIQQLQHAVAFRQHSTQDPDSCSSRPPPAPSVQPSSSKRRKHS